MSSNVPLCVSVTEVQVASNQPNNVSKKLEISRYPERQPLVVIYQGQTIDGLTQSWTLNPPLVITRNDSFTVKVKAHRKLLGFQVSGTSARIQSSLFLEAYLSSGVEWRREIGDGLTITFRLVGQGPIPGSSSSIRLNRTISTVDSLRDSTGTTLTQSTSTSTSQQQHKAYTSASSSLPGDPDAALPSSADNILAVCPRFRILVIGKSGVGKSSLINKTFGVNQASVSEDQPGVSDINFEITSSANDRFVLHDSQGFEHGESANLDTVTRFVRERMRMPMVKDRLHAIWLCTEIPSTGGRVFERGDKRFLGGLHENVPVIVVFTKFDLLVRHIDYEMEDPDPLMPEEDRRRLILGRADEVFRDECINALQAVSPSMPFARVSTKHDYRHTIEDLITLTFNRVSQRDNGIASLTTGIAQRISPKVKLNTSIAIGKQRYWLAILASTDFPGRKLSACLDVIHKDLVTVWNFQDPDEFLLSNTVKAAMRHLMKDMVSQQTGTQTTNTHSISAGGAGVATWFSRVYERSQETVRCLMAYVVDLTLIMRLMFEDQDGYLSVNPLIFRDYFDRYELSATRSQNHAAITGFVDSLSVRDRTSSAKIVKKIEELVWAGCVELSSSP